MAFCTTPKGRLAFPGSLFVRPAGTSRVGPAAIAADMLRQALSGDLGPHPRRILNGPAIFAVRLGLVTPPFQLSFDRRLIEIFDCHGEVRDVRFIFGMLALAKVESVLSEFQETYG